jgi:hypothetical protein
MLQFPVVVNVGKQNSCRERTRNFPISVGVLVLSKCGPRDYRGCEFRLCTPQQDLYFPTFKTTGNFKMILMHKKVYSLCRTLRSQPFINIIHINLSVFKSFLHLRMARAGRNV